MGEQLQNIGLRLSADDLRQVDDEVAKYSEIGTKRQGVLRALVRLGLRCIALGIVRGPDYGAQELQVQSLLTPLTKAEKNLIRVTGATAERPDMRRRVNGPLRRVMLTSPGDAAREARSPSASRITPFLVRRSFAYGEKIA